MKQRYPVWPLLCLFLGLFPMGLHAQVPQPNISLPSANATALGQYGEVPVSKYTGIPDIRIPLYTLKDGKLSLPISLSYHAGGVMPDVRPGWTGLNFTLMAGGAISRVVRGLPDDLDAPVLPLRRNHFDISKILHPLQLSIWSGTFGDRAGYYYHHNVNRGKNWKETARLKDMVFRQKDAKDNEPDMFRFHFMGYSGSFFLTETGQWAVKSEHNIKVVFDEHNIIGLPSEIQAVEENYHSLPCLKGTPRTFGGFTLITPDGMRYHFGNIRDGSPDNTDAIEYSIPWHQQMIQPWMATTWYLTRVEHPDGQQIDLHYGHDDYSSVMNLSFSMSRTWVYDHNDVFTGIAYEHQGNPAPKYGSYDGSLIRPVYLESIRSAHQVIDFERSDAQQLGYPTEAYLKNDELSKALNGIITDKICVDAFNRPEIHDPLYHQDIYWHYLHDQWPTNDKQAMLRRLKTKKLDEIIIKSRTAHTGLRFAFAYNNRPDERLMLQCLTESSWDGTQSKPPYSFSYYDGAALPPYLSEAVDHWGYFNGNTEKCFTLPRSDNFVDLLLEKLGRINILKAPARDRDVALAGTLRAIRYPTGGYTTFEYEQHTYAHYLDSDRQRIVITGRKAAGGLRIKKISSHSGPSDTHPLTRIYHYNSEYDPVNGAQYPSGTLDGLPKYSWSAEERRPGERGDSRIISKRISYQGRQPLGINEHLPHMTYNRVIEQEVGNGYTITDYTGFIDEDGTRHYDDLLPGLYGTSIFTSAFGDRSHERGHPLRERLFDNDGRLVKETNIRYARLSEDAARAVVSSSRTTIIKKEPGKRHSEFRSILLYEARPYLNYYYRYLPIGREEILHYSSGKQRIKSFFEYNSEGLLSRRYTVNSDGRSHGQDHRYAHDFHKSLVAECPTEPQCDCGTPPRYPIGTAWETCMERCDEEHEKCRTNGKKAKGRYAKALWELYRAHRNPPIETRTWAGSPEKVTGGQLSEFADFGTDGGLQVERVRTLHVAQPQKIDFSYIDANGYLSLSGDYDVEGRVLAYAQGNPTEILGRDGIRTVYLWGHDHTRPLARISNARTADIRRLLATTDLTFRKGLTAQQVRTLRQGLPMTSTATFYDYDLLAGIQKTVDLNGKSHSFTYDKLLRPEKELDQDLHVLKEYGYDYAPASCPEMEISGSRTFPSDREITLQARASGGLPPYTYTWKLPGNSRRSTPTGSPQVKFTLRGPLRNITATCILRDALGSKVMVDHTFSVDAPPDFIKVIDVSFAGRTVERHQPMVIQWDQYGGGPGRIELLQGSTSRFIATVADLSASPRGHEWYINVPPGEGYRIRIRATASGLSDTSRPFNIQAATCLRDGQQSRDPDRCCSGRMTAEGDCSTSLLRCPPGLTCYCGCSP